MKKLAAIVLCTMLAMTTLTGCWGNNKNDGTDVGTNDTMPNVGNPVPGTEGTNNPNSGTSNGITDNPVGDDAITGGSSAGGNADAQINGNGASNPESTDNGANTQENTNGGTKDNNGKAAATPEKK